MQKLISVLSLVIFTLLVMLPAPASASAPVLIRDTEIEGIIEEWAEPLVRAADLPVGGVQIILVQSPELNAFVAGGANIFIYTGLIERTDGPGELLGVLAHELGHIAGGHLIRGRAAMERASYESILGTILGIGAAIASGDGAAAAAISTGASSIAARRFMAFSRVQESSADQAALTFMDKAGMDSAGLGSFLGELESEELLPASRQSEYVRTHPLTSNRIAAVETRSKESAAAGKAFPAEWVEQHARMRAKLIGFISPEQVAWKYDDQDKGIPARYARAIAAYRQHDVAKALKEIDSLIASEPQNPYFQELKGQMLVDFGQVSEAIPYYRKSVSLLKEAPLIQIALGHALIESGDNPSNLNEAVRQLEQALIREPRSSRAYRLLGIAYGKLGQEGKAKLNLAEESVLQGRFDYAKDLAEGAVRTFPEGSREWLQAKDILNYLENRKDR
ncbi:MAG: M48 family metalloprotease [Alphaproteobacteria bacterium]|nr:M48 family metalloprotease [Alphaproteobacteria bacterium]